MATGLSTPNQSVVTPPAIGSAAPSDPPSGTLSKKEISEIIKAEVDAQVAERVRAIEAGDKTREDFSDEDQQFANFDKKLEVYGVDLQEQLPGFVLRWINDERDRIPRSQLQGWDFVKRSEVGLNDKVTPLNKDLGENIAVYVGANEAGQPMRAFLMKIPKEAHEKLMRRIDRQNDQIQEAIRRGAIGPALSQGGYAGTDQGQVKIKYGTR